MIVPLGRVSGNHRPRQLVVTEVSSYSRSRVGYLQQNARSVGKSAGRGNPALSTGILREEVIPEELGKVTKGGTEKSQQN